MTWIDAVAHPVVAYLSNTLGPGLMLAVLVWAMLRFGFKLSAASRYVIFYGTLLMIASLPLISHIHFSFDFSAAETDAVMESALNENENVNPLAERKPSSKQVEIAPTVPTGTEIETVAVSSDSAATSTWNISELFSISLFGLWALGVIGWMVVLIKNIVSLRKLKRSATPLLGYQDCLNQCLEQTKVKRRIKLMASDQISVPMSIGFFQPMILLPTHMIEQLNETELNHVLLHEIAHLKRRDDWTKLLQKLIRSAFFFHPAVWWLDRQLDFEREVACDDWVITKQQTRNEYALNLIKIAEHAVNNQHEMMTTAFFTKKTLQRRVTMILSRNNSNDNRFGKLKLTGIFVTLFIVVTAFSQTVPLLGISNTETVFEENNSPSLYYHRANFSLLEEPITITYNGRTFESFIDSEPSFEKMNLQNFDVEAVFEDTNLRLPHSFLTNSAPKILDGKVYWMTDLKLESLGLDGTSQGISTYSVVSQGLPAPKAIDFEIHSASHVLYVIINGHGVVTGGLEGGALTNLILKADIATVTGDSFANFIEIELDEVNEKIYILTTASPPISNRIVVVRANLDGSDLELYESPEINPTRSLVIDAIHEKMYWINQTGSPFEINSIWQANLDGSNVKEILTLGRHEEISNLVLDTSTETLFWSQGNTRQVPTAGRSGSRNFFNTLDTKIQRLKLDGSEVETIISGKFRTSNLALGR